MNFLKKLGKKIKKAWKSVWKFLRGNSELAVKVTEAAKDVLRSKAVSFAVGLTNTQIDDKLLPKAINFADKIAFQVGVAHKIFQESETDHGAIDRLLEHLKTEHPMLQEDFLIRFSAMMNQFLSDGELTWNEALVGAQFLYVELKKKQSSE